MRARRLAGRLHSASVRLVRRARVADRALGLSPERLSALSVLVFAGPQTVTGLAAIEQVSAPAISRMAKGLVAAGLVRRLPGADERAVLLAASSKGRRLVAKGRAGRTDAVAALLGGLSPQDLEALERAADILSRLDRPTPPRR